MSEESRYILVEKLTRGGMAEIYLGRSSSRDGFKRVCCIKRILPHYSQEKEYIEMFRDEAHICKRLQHANIVRVEGFEEVEDSYAIIMEFVDGADLRKILVSCENAGVSIPIPMALYIAAEIARGLHYAHTKIDEITQKPLKIVHRDISPQNILVSFEGEAKITDFGIAQAKSKSTETKPGIVKGKYSYMSPEQIMAKPVDARTDVFALAIVLWEMVAMERLFHGENDVITIQKVKNCEVKRIPRGQKRKENEIDDELEAIILQGLQKDLKKRYKDAKQFEVAIRKYLNKKYPTFSPNELSTFLKELLADQLVKSQENIKKALTTTDFTPNNRKTPVKIYETPDSAVGAPPVSSLDVPISGKLPDFNIARQASTGVKPAFGTMGPGLNPNPQRQEYFKSLKPATGMKPQQTLPYYPKKGNSKLILVGLVVVIGVTGLAIAAKKFYQSRTSPAQVTIETIPQTVKIKVDGIPLNNDRYVQTPIRERLRIGEHSITVTRDGFVPQTVDATIAPGDKSKKVDIVLTRQASFSPVKLKLAEGSVDKVWTEIDDGVDSGYAPRKIDDLVYGKAHFLRVFPQYPKRRIQFTCAFTPKSKNWRAPFVITIDVDAKKCTATAP